jgi:hypothetical protein
MEIPKHQIFLKSLILLPANSHAKMAPDNSIWRRSAVEAGSNQARSRALFEALSQFHRAMSQGHKGLG